ncbi:MAG: methyltransferase, partial [Candidatus Krumholzibacteria bacterium]|nr:methyltransferase [Candidatus Krumholzibacteria bacterium]
MLSFLPEPIERYLITHSTSESDLLRALARETRAETSNPQMQVGIIEGLFLKFLARSLGARRVLEIGTFTGYSALMMAEGIADGGEVITCDIDRRAAAIAQKCWAKSPHGKK